MNNETYHVGDVLRIRSWEDMEREFGLSAKGSIECPNYFVERMTPLCGFEFVVTETSGHGDSEVLQRLSTGERSWVISAAMCERIERADPITAYNLEDIL